MLMHARCGFVEGVFGTRRPMVVALLVAGLALQAQANAGVDLDFEDHVAGWMEEHGVPAVSVGVIEDGAVKYVKAFGEIRDGVPADEGSLFNIASMTKPVVAMLTLKLVDRGEWSLDEPLHRYWVDPDVKDDPRHELLTTRHVLNHRTGFVNWRSGHPSKRLTFDFEPGTAYHYSGEGFEYLRKALEIKFGRPLEELLQTEIFGPLGMDDTSYWSEGIDPQRLARCHDADGNDYGFSGESSVNAASNILSTPADYCRFLIHVMNGADLSQDLYDEMTTPVSRVNEHLAWGLGWQIIEDLPNGEYGLEHGGTNTGMWSLSFILPASRRGTVVMTNGDGGAFVYGKLIREAFDEGGRIVDSILGVTPREAVAVSDEVLERYVGNWLDSDGREHVIVKGDGVLEFSGTGLPDVTLLPESENVFFLEDFDVQFRFAGRDSFTLVSGGIVDWTAKRTHR
jgi:CubicO group peptidase (beta-lactamase class C family)